MVKNLLLIGSLIFSIHGFGQIEYSDIDQKSKEVPDSLTNYSEIADYLIEGLQSEKRKSKSALYMDLSQY